MVSTRVTEATLSDLPSYRYKRDHPTGKYEVVKVVKVVKVVEVVKVVKVVKGC